MILTLSNQTRPPVAVFSPRPALLKTAHQPAPADQFTKTLRFEGYGPSTSELDTLQEALKGSTADILRPRYLASPKVVNALEALMTQNTPLPQDILLEIAQQKQEALNLHHFLLNKPLLSQADALTDATQFAQTLSRRVGRILNEALNGESGFSSAAVNTFIRFVALSAPVIFTMGFVDGTDHSGDVAQLALLQAGQNGASPLDQLQSALVGWLHDPKLKNDVSWSNLATHPVVGSATAREVLKDARLQQLLQQVLNEQGQSTALATFNQGVVEALAINNDSEFVLNNVILANTFKHPLGEPGLAEQVPAARPWFIQRFEAPANAQALPALPSEVERQLAQASLSTDLRGIRLNALKQALNLPDDLATRRAYQQLVRGELGDKLLLWPLKNRLMAISDSIVNPKVSGTSLLAHHEDVDNGKQAALALTIADPLLLSPHKIMESSALPTPLHRMRSFLTSIFQNIEALPQAKQPIGRQWLKDLTDSMIKAVEQLTGNVFISTLPRTVSLPEALTERQRFLEAEDTWKKTSRQPDGTTQVEDLGATQAKDNPGLITTIANTLKETYEQALRTSKAMFGAPKKSTPNAA